MNETTALYYDGASARPVQVRVLLFDQELHVCEESEQRLIQRFSFEGMTYNQAGEKHYVYLDTKGLQYLQFTSIAFPIERLRELIAQANPHWGQKLMKQKMPVLLVIALVVILGAYFLILNMVPFLGMRMIGVRQEITMGNKLKQVMLKETTALGAEIDISGTKNLQDFADKLNLSSTYPIRLTLVNRDLVNAYALPGGQIVVYRGILEKIKSPEALAALLAHESTHVNERHSLRSMLRNAASGIVVTIIFSDATGVSGALVSNANALNGLRYSRSLEAEADRKGMDLLITNKVNAKGMKELMEELEKEGDIPGNLSFLSSHPLTKQRIKAATDYIKEHPQTGTQRNDLSNLFKLLKGQD
jgi:beta-barrel assembly-enhancing protease